jgi:8-oxo-dGTP diphosphatase
MQNHATQGLETDTPQPIQAALAIAWCELEGRLRLLVTRRPEGKRFAGLWEWPGGAIEPGEGPVAAACRELAEETGLRSAEGAAHPLGLHDDPGPPRIVFHLVTVHLPGAPEARRIACSDARWLEPAQAFALPFPPANAAINRLVQAWASSAPSAPQAPRPSPAR